MAHKEELKKMVVPDPFWADDYSILYNQSRLVEFVPTNEMSLTEKLNAISRFSVYAGILLLLIYQDSIYLYVPIIGFALMYLVNRYNITEKFADGFDMNTHPVPAGTKAADYTYDVNGHLCQKPTKDNPFMNVLLSDYADDPARPPACDIDDPKIRADMKKMYEFGLYKNVDDIWDRNNSQRQFYTNPSTTIPNDRDSWMKWCWSVPYVCRDGDQNACNRYELGVNHYHGKIY